MFTIKFDGEVVGRALQSVYVGTQNELKTIVGEAGNYAVQTGAGAAHVITGHMRKNIQQAVQGEDHVQVLAKARYSGFENARGGDHAFFDIMYEETVNKYPALFFSQIKDVIRKAKLNSGGIGSVGAGGGGG